MNTDTKYKFFNRWFVSQSIDHYYIRNFFIPNVKMPFNSI